MLVSCVIRIIHLFVFHLVFFFPLFSFFLNVFQCTRTLHDHSAAPYDTMGHALHVNLQWYSQIPELLRKIFIEIERNSIIRDTLYSGHLLVSEPTSLEKTISAVGVVRVRYLVRLVLDPIPVYIFVMTVEPVKYLVTNSRDNTRFYTGERFQIWLFLEVSDVTWYRSVIFFRFIQYFGVYTILNILNMSTLNDFLLILISFTSSK